jgi:hypothetical protein
MSYRNRLRRLEKEAQGNGIRLRLQDGTVRVFEDMEIQKELYLALCDLLRDTARDSEVLTAVRNATPESRKEFEKKFGPITLTEYIITPTSRGGQVEVKTLTEDGQVERVLYEGDSEEAALVRDGACAGTDSTVPKELPRPPVAGRWLYGIDDEDLSEP